jgi:hypothetical protein
MNSTHMSIKLSIPASMLRKPRNSETCGSCWLDFSINPLDPTVSRNSQIASRQWGDFDPIAKRYIADDQSQCTGQTLLREAGPMAEFTTAQSRAKHHREDRETHLATQASHWSQASGAARSGA